jgi:hypothetical protein
LNQLFPPPPTSFGAVNPTRPISAASRIISGGKVVHGPVPFQSARIDDILQESAESVSHFLGDFLLMID